MKRLRLLLICVMAIMSMASYAQTVVEFVAGIDKGSKVCYEGDYWKDDDEVKKGGVTMSTTNGGFAADKYRVYNLFDEIGRDLTFVSDKSYIISIEFVDGKNLNGLRVEGYDSSVAKWTGKSTRVNFYVQSDVMVTFSKVIVTLGQQPAKLEFAHPDEFNYIEQQMSTALAPTLKSCDEVVVGFPLTYESSNPAVADIIVTNGITAVDPEAEGSAVITARFAGNDKYESAEAHFTLHVVNGMNIFHESFDKVGGVGGNDGNFSYTDWNDKLRYGRMDNYGWEVNGVEFLGSWVYNASQCVRIEMGASFTTPEFANLSGDAFFIFRAAQNRDEETTVGLSISGGGTLDKESVVLSGKEFADYVILVKDATPNTRVTMSCGMGGSLFLDDVKVERAVVLDAAADNSSVLRDNASMAEGTTVDVMLKRSLSSKCWNTFCLPFSVKKDDMASVFGANAFVVAFDYFDAEENTVCFKQSTEIAAGTPCLVWPSVDITNIMLRNVTLTDKVYNRMSNGVSFKGVYNPMAISYDDVVLDVNNQFDSCDDEGHNLISGFNAYFSGLSNASTAILKVAVTPTSIIGVSTGGQVNDGKVYTVEGRYAGDSVSHLAKGIYIVNGKKVVVR